GLMGWCGEVLFTGIHDFIRTHDTRLPSRTSLSMFPIYGLVLPMFERLHDAMRDRAPAPLRAAAYAAGLFGVEYSTGRLLRRLLGERRREWLEMGGEDRVRKQHAEGKLTVRERLEILFDPGSFTEFALLAHHQSAAPSMQGKATPADGCVCGTGLVDGRRVAVI